MPPAVWPKKKEKRKSMRQLPQSHKPHCAKCSLFPPPKQVQGKCHQPHPCCHPTLDTLGLCLQSTLQWGPPTRSLLFLHCLQAGSPEAPQLTLTPPSLCSALFLEGPFLKLQVNFKTQLKHPALSGTFPRVPCPQKPAVDLPADSHSLTQGSSLRCLRAALWPLSLPYLHAAQD